jgi:hypothetical protein
VLGTDRQEVDPCVWLMAKGLVGLKLAAIKLHQWADNGQEETATSGIPIRLQ